MICPFCAEDLDNYVDGALRSRISQLEAQAAQMFRIIEERDRTVHELEKENKELQSLIKVYDIRVTELTYLTQRHEL